MSEQDGFQRNSQASCEKSGMGDLRQAANCICDIINGLNSETWCQLNLLDIYGGTFRHPDEHIYFVSENFAAVVVADEYLSETQRKVALSVYQLGIVSGYEETIDMVRWKLDCSNETCRLFQLAYRHGVSLRTWWRSYALIAKSLFPERCPSVDYTGENDEY